MRSETTVNTQPKQLEQQNNRLKKVNAKVYYKVRKHSTTDVELQRFQALENEKQRKWKAREKQLAEQLANLRKELQDELWSPRWIKSAGKNIRDPNCEDTHH